MSVRAAVIRPVRMVVPLSASKQFVRKIAHHGCARQGCAAPCLIQASWPGRSPSKTRVNALMPGHPCLHLKPQKARMPATSAGMTNEKVNSICVADTNLCRRARKGAGPPGCGHPGGPPDRRGGGWGRTRRSHLVVPEAKCSGGVYGFFRCFRLRLLRPLVRLVAAGDERVQRPRAAESARIRAPIDGYPTKSGLPGAGAW
jgi:hypothetical protein